MLRRRNGKIVSLQALKTCLLALDESMLTGTFFKLEQTEYLHRDRNLYCCGHLERPTMNTLWTRPSHSPSARLSLFAEKCARSI